MKFNYIRAHISYLFTKRNIFILTIVNIIILIYSLYAGNVFTPRNILDMNRSTYKDNFISSIFSFIKIIYISLMIYVGSIYNSLEYNQYKSFFITNNKSKINFEISRIITFDILSLFEILYIFIIYLIIIIICPYGNNALYYYCSFINLYILTLLYYFITVILSKIFKSNIVLIVLIVTYFISYVNSSYYSLSNFIKIYMFFIPSLLGDECEYLYGDFISLIYLFFLIIISGILIYKTDE